MRSLAVAAAATVATLAGAGSAHAAFAPVPGELSIVIARTGSPVVVVDGRALRPLLIPRLPRAIPYIAPGRVRNRSGTDRTPSVPFGACSSSASPRRW